MANAVSTLTSSAIETRPTLRPAKAEEVFDALDALYSGFHKTYDSVGAKTTALYVKSVSGEPLWAVNAAIWHLVDGTAPGVNRNFLPTVPAFAVEVRRQTATMRERHERQEKIDNEQRRLDEQYEADLAAKRSPLSPEARERLDAFIGKAARSM